ncbi:hypothetical protein ACHHYP_08360 [Achlya hypogyna]|uniref:Secreted protein n=1 Tax=Achlya hypogyna TaxID=1202772 RepID=A0A0A7CNV3_ACHHY|nr:secreted protein [Achlya hypogyna]OQR98635.1 hypothetical protein ACHHYP_08360 [Achlya hypogyna]
MMSFRRLLLALCACAALLEITGANQVALVASSPEPLAEAMTTCEMTADGRCATPATFEPTHEWQEILPNQAIPAGLHVRINLATGKKEAKFLSDDDAEDGASLIAPDETLPGSTPVPTPAPTAAPSSTPGDDVEEAVRIGESLFNVLAGLPEPPALDGLDIHTAHSQLSKEDFAAYVAKLWKARQAELKEASEAIRDEAQHMQKLIDVLVAPHAARASLLEALEALEWEVQDIDKARDFNTLGGLLATVPYLNATDLGVRAQAAWVVGSAVKHFAEAQTWALQAGALPYLLHALAPPSATPPAGFYAMQRKALYALTALLQAHEAAQAVFARNGGVDVVASVAADVGAPTGLRLKAVLGLHHLIAEFFEKPENLALAAIHAAVHESSRYCAAAVALLEATTPQDALSVLEALGQALKSPPSPCTSAIVTPAVAATVRALDASWRADVDLDSELQEDVTSVAITLVEYIEALAVQY